MTLVLALFMSAAAFAQSDCEPGLSAEPQARLQEAIQELHRLGLSELTRPFDENRIEIVYRARRLPGQRDIGWRSQGNQRTLVVRHLEWNSEKERQEAVWKLGQALYGLQLGEPSRVAQLQSELAFLSVSLPAVKQGPAKRSWPRRLLIAGAVIPVLMLAAPYVYQVPKYIENHLPMAFTRPSPPPSTVLFDSSNQPVSPSNQEKLSIRKQVLEKQINEEQNKIYPDLQKLETLKAEHRELIEKYPFLLNRPEGRK